MLGPVAVGLVLGAGACRDGSGPVSEPVTGYRPPAVTSGPAGERVVTNTGARERLLLAREPGRNGAGRDLTLLFLDGRAATPLGGGGTAWADLDGDRVLLFDQKGRVERIVQASGGGGYSSVGAAVAVGSAHALSDPVLAMPVGEGLRVEQRDGSSVLFPADGPPLRLEPSRYPAVGASPDARFVGRSALYFALAPVIEGDPLLWRIGDDGETRPIGRAEPGTQPLLGEIENAGWATAARRDGTYFASALRPELLRFDAAGELVWRATWPLERELVAPRLEAVAGALQPAFSVVHHGIARGPDGHVYVLAASRQDHVPERLLAFDDDGVLIREAQVDPGAAVFVDRRGRVHMLSLDEALARTPAADRADFEPFDLPSLSGEGRVRLEDHSGQVVVLNFWASWCPPCRRELPLLHELGSGLADQGVVVIGLNEDTRAADGRRFLDEIGGASFESAAGGGELRAQYGYRGLPYTVILDREHRVVRAVYGFGTSIDPIRAAVEEVLE